MLRVYAKRLGFVKSKVNTSTFFKRTQGERLRKALKLLVLQEQYLISLAKLNGEVIEPKPEAPIKPKGSGPSERTEVMGWIQALRAIGRAA